MQTVITVSFRFWGLASFPRPVVSSSTSETVFKVVRDSYLLPNFNEDALNISPNKPEADSRGEDIFFRGKEESAWKECFLSDS